MAQKRRSSNHRKQQSETSRPYVLLPLAVVCSLAVSAVLAFGNPSLWTVSAQAVEPSTPPQSVPSEPQTPPAEPETGTGVIAEYKAVSQSEDTRRANNIALASEAIDGSVIEPGQTFSFNEVVGNTTEDERYEDATILLGNETEEMPGGGICQVSTALYIASLKADLEIVERYHHSAATDYAPIGLDATIDYGKIDLRIKNNTEDPITISAQAEGHTVTVSLQGTLLEEGTSIEATSKILQSSEAEAEKEEYKNKLKEGEELYVVESYRVYYKDGVKQTSERLAVSTYVVPASATVMLGEGGTDPIK